jgi:hypothetical protein
MTGVSFLEIPVVVAPAVLIEWSGIEPKTLRAILRN